MERVAPEHPSLIDSEHRVAHLYGVINISTIVWIDENGRIVRPPLIEYGTDMFKDFHGQDPAPHLDAVRRWVLNNELPLDAAATRNGLVPPTQMEQLARAEFALAWHLHRAGNTERAAAHFDRAGELAPLDWTIRRGSMPIRGKDPMGEEFFELYTSWQAEGAPAYASLAAERRGLASKNK
ncbi:MAG: hypothetical protein ACI8TX_001771 [Hyphomicrobiaceae bacterium]